MNRQKLFVDTLIKNYVSNDIRINIENILGDKNLDIDINSDREDHYEVKIHLDIVLNKKELTGIKKDLANKYEDYERTIVR